MAGRIFHEEVGKICGGQVVKGFVDEQEIFEIM